MSVTEQERQQKQTSVSLFLGEDGGRLFLRMGGGITESTGRLGYFESPARSGNASMRSMTPRMKIALETTSSSKSDDRNGNSRCVVSRASRTPEEGLVTLVTELVPLLLICFLDFCARGVCGEKATGLEMELWWETSTADGYFFA